MGIDRLLKPQTDRRCEADGIDNGLVKKVEQANFIEIQLVGVQRSWTRAGSLSQVELS